MIDVGGDDDDEDYLWLMSNLICLHVIFIYSLYSLFYFISLYSYLNLWKFYHKL